MDYLIKIDEFEGPLDLLLHLIKQSDLDIYDINIAVITEQYLDYINKMEELNLSIASSYLVMAAELIELKSKELLPKKEETKEDDFEEKITIDVPMPLAYVTESFIENLSILEPFGAANEKPVFAQKNIRFVRGYKMGKNQNMARFDVMDEENRRYTLVCFRGLEKLIPYMEEKTDKQTVQTLFDQGLYGKQPVILDVIYYPSINEYRGKTSVQYILEDYR